MGKKLGGSLLLFLTALIWGLAFVAQRSGMDSVGPFTFLAMRSILTLLALLPFAVGRIRRGAIPPGMRFHTILRGVLCGCAIFLASAFQQCGIVYTTAGKTGFLTALYIVFVPVLRLVGGKKAGKALWFSVALAVAGLYFLCAAGDGGFSVGTGELLVLCGALMFAVHILLVGRFAPDMDSILLSLIQFAVCAGLATAAMFTFETPRMESVLSAWLPIVYAGILSGAVAYTMQIIGQKHTDPAVASLLMSLEAVFSALAGWLLLHESLTPFELAGCGLVFAAVVLAQLPRRVKAPRMQ